MLLVGNFEVGHVGRSLLSAAHDLGVDTLTLDTREAFSTSALRRRLNWHVRGHRPPLLTDFSAKVLKACNGFEPHVFLSTGTAPVNAAATRQMSRNAVTCVNYSTDDPWGASHSSAWFFDALTEYDHVYTPRLRNLKQMQDLHGPAVEYLPFGYDPDLYHPDELSVADCQHLSSDILFVGGGDRDRLPFIEELVRTGFRPALYGGYWQRDVRTREFARGLASPETIRRATIAAKVSLCLVRRANRDGHVMRSFETAAIGGCMLVEDTEEHRRIFGPEGEAVVYFGTMPEMTTKLSWLLEHPEKRDELRRAAMLRITTGRNTYRDRLVTMLDTAIRRSGRAA